MDSPLHTHPCEIMTTGDQGDFDSTLVRRGAQATTFTDMMRFVNEIEKRPLQKLIFDLPELARLSDVKFALARKMVCRRLSALPEHERAQIREIAESVASTVRAVDAERMLSVFVERGQA